MNVNIYTSDDFTTSKWSGGTTTELYISPSDAKYKDLDFDIRISSAKVETPHSNFTNLPQVHRQLMILDGSINIKHKNRYTKHLQAFEADTFEGDWDTSSEGICTDFNVMTRGAYKSKTDALQLTNNENTTINLELEKATFFIYLYSGAITVNTATQSYTLQANQLLVMEDTTPQSLELKAQNKSQLVIVNVIK